jgi:hypothetical protein
MKDIINKIDQMAKIFDKEAFSIEAKILYKDKEGFILTNENEDYHFAILEKEDFFVIFDIKKDSVDLFNVRYIPDYSKSIKMNTINMAVARLYGELERRKIIYFLKRIKEKINNKAITEKEYIELIIQESANYGIAVKKEGSKLLFENNNSTMEIIKKEYDGKRVYEVYINNIFLFSFENFIKTIETALIHFVLNQYKKIGKKEIQKGVKKLKNNNFKLTPEKD